MNNKGFTLVELLAVIVLISVVALIGTTSVIGVRKAINKKLFFTKLDLVIEAAKDYGSDNKDKISDSTNNINIEGIDYKYIETTVDDLINKKYYDTDETDSDGNPALIDNRDNSSHNKIKVKIYKKNNRIHACICDDTSIAGYDSEKIC